MDWMTIYGGVIDCVNRSITLTTPEGRRIIYKSNLDFNDIRLNHLKGVSLEEVAVVREYPDVFSDELPGMPPDRDIEFLIELLPGTSPIAKRPYPMSTDELKELKKQLGEQLKKGFIREREFVPVGSTSFVCREERPKSAVGYGLPFIERGDHQKQISITKDQ
jgi:hypothetical protein